MYVGKYVYGNVCVCVYVHMWKYVCACVKICLRVCAKMCVYGNTCVCVCGNVSAEMSVGVHYFNFTFIDAVIDKLSSNSNLTYLKRHDPISPYITFIANPFS